MDASRRIRARAAGLQQGLPGNPTQNETA
jgi:hypothetical protein